MKISKFKFKYITNNNNLTEREKKMTYLLTTDCCPSQKRQYWLAFCGGCFHSCLSQGFQYSNFETFCYQKQRDFGLKKGWMDVAVVQVADVQLVLGQENVENVVLVFCLRVGH